MAINATAVWRVRPSGSNTNGGGYDAGIVGAGTDYSQQNSAQASGTHGTATGTTAFSDTVAANFTSAMVGNALYITGTGLTTGFYFCTAYSSATAITLDRSPGTGTVGTWHLGGGWADFWTNTTSSGPLVPGNTVYILGSGVPNPSSYTYDYSPSTYFTPASGSSTTGSITFAGDPSTPNYSTGGMPCIKTQGLLFFSNAYIIMQSLYFVCAAANFGSDGIAGGNSGSLQVIKSCVLDQFGYDVALSGTGSGVAAHIFSSEVFSSQAKVSTNANYAIGLIQAYGCILQNCNIHDCIGPAVTISRMASVTGNIIAKNGGVGLLISNGGSNFFQHVSNNTIDANVGNGIEFDSQQSLAVTTCINNIISGHVTASTYGLTVDSGTAAANTLVALFCDYNTFYNNATNYNAISAGPHDTALGTTPYVAQSTENYTLA
jgi:hypothetical protein